MRTAPPLGAAAAVRLLQGKYTLDLLRALTAGPLRLHDLAGAAGVRSATTLQLRLRQLEAAGVVTRRGGRCQLTERGAALGPLFPALARFQADHPDLAAPALFAALQRRHALAVMRALMAGELGFNALQRVLGAPSATTLSRRLTELEAAGLLVRTVHSAMPPRTSYRHSAAGVAFSSVIGQIVLWGEGLPGELIGALLDPAPDAG